MLFREGVMSFYRRLASAIMIEVKTVSLRRLKDYSLILEALE